jgi:DNA primase
MSGSGPLADSRETRWKTQAKEHDERSQRFLDSYREKTTALLEALVPDIETSTLLRLKTVGFRFTDGIVEKVENDRKRLEEKLEALQAHPILHEAEESGCFGTELEKLSGHYDALQPFLKKCFKHPRFDQLILDGYGTDEYPKRMWHLSYYIDRRTAREIEDLCDGRSFATIRQEAIQALEASKVLEDRIRSLKQKRKLQATTERRRRTVQSRLESHTEIWLVSARRQLLEELESDPAAFTDKLLEFSPEPAFEWRLAKEVMAEHSTLWSRFLRPAREAIDCGHTSRCDFFLKEYEHLVDSLKRFDQPDAPKETIDWKSFLYQQPPGKQT